MAGFPGNPVVTGPISLSASGDTYPTHIDALGQGGLMTIDTVANRNLIPSTRRKFGMLVTVYGDSTAANNKTYILANPDLGGTNTTLTDNANWIQFTAGLTNGNKGDVTIASNGASITVNNSAITYAKIQNVSANRLLGRIGTTGVAQEVIVGEGLSFDTDKIRLGGSISSSAGLSLGNSSTSISFIVTASRVASTSGVNSFQWAVGTRADNTYYGLTGVSGNSNSGTESYARLSWALQNHILQTEEGATNTTTVFTDSNASKRGIEYSATGYVTQLHSLVDKEYADGFLRGKTLPAAPGAGQDLQALRWNNTGNAWEFYTPSAGSAYTFANGLTDTAGTIRLGGALTATTSITIGAFNFSIGESNNTGTVIIRGGSGYITSSYFSGSRTDIDLYANSSNRMTFQSSIDTPVGLGKSFTSATGYYAIMKFGRGSGVAATGVNGGVFLSFNDSSQAPATTSSGPVSNFGAVVENATASSYQSKFRFSTHISNVLTDIAEFGKTSWFNGIDGLVLGATSVSASTLLELSSTTKALLLSRIATEGNITTPANGMLYYNTTDHAFRGRENAVWVTLTNKAYVDSRIASKAVSSLVSAPGAGQNNYVIAWDNANNQYTLVAGGGGGGITNGAAANELMKSDGTNAVASGFFSSVLGDLSLGGAATTGSSRTLTATGSAADIAFNITTKGTGSGAYIQVGGNTTYGVYAFAQNPIVRGYGAGVIIERSDTATMNAIYTSAQFKTNGASGAVVGYGNRLRIDVDTIEAVRLDTVATVVTAAAETYNFKIWVKNAGTIREAVSISNSNLDLGSSANPESVKYIRALNSTTDASLVIQSQGALLMQSLASNGLTIQAGVSGGGTLSVIGQNVGLLQTGEFGSGIGVLSIKSAGTNPTTNPTTGGILYGDATDGHKLKWRVPGGTVYDLTATGGGGSVFYTVEDVTGTTYTFQAEDNGKMKRFTNAAGCTATVPSGLTAGWSSIAYRADGAGNVTLTAGAGATYEGVGNVLTAAKTSATVLHRGSNVIVGIGALTSTLLSGSGSAGRVTYWSDTNVLTSSSSFVYDTTTNPGFATLGAPYLSGTFISGITYGGLRTGSTNYTFAIEPGFAAGHTGSTSLTFTINGASATFRKINTLYTTSLDLTIASTGISLFQGGIATAQADDFRIRGMAGNVTFINGHDILLLGGTAYGTSGNGNGGHVILRPGVRRIAGSGVDGQIQLDPLTGYVSFTNSSIAPTSLVDKVAIYSKDASSSAEMYIKTESGAEVCISGLVDSVLHSSATLTLTEAHRGKFVYFSVACTVTVPNNLKKGFNCILMQDGAGTVTLTTSSSTVNGKTATTAQYDTIGLIHYKDTNTYFAK